MLKINNVPTGTGESPYEYSLWRFLFLLPVLLGTFLKITTEIQAYPVLIGIIFDAHSFYDTFYCKDLF